MFGCERLVRIGALLYAGRFIDLVAQGRDIEAPARDELSHEEARSPMKTDLHLAAAVHDFAEDSLGEFVDTARCSYRGGRCSRRILEIVDEEECRCPVPRVFSDNPLFIRDDRVDARPQVPNELEVCRS